MLNVVYFLTAYEMYQLYQKETITVLLYSMMKSKYEAYIYPYFTHSKYQINLNAKIVNVRCLYMVIKISLEGDRQNKNESTFPNL